MKTKKNIIEVLGTGKDGTIIKSPYSIRVNGTEVTDVVNIVPVIDKGDGSLTVYLELMASEVIYKNNGK